MLIAIGKRKIIHQTNTGVVSIAAVALRDLKADALYEYWDPERQLIILSKEPLDGKGEKAE